MKYVLFLMMILFSSQAVALNCERQPTCEGLNYSKEDNPKCDKNGYILCPYDQSYKKCVQYSCESLGFTKSDKSEWCKNIAVCPSNPNYTLCTKATCDIGDVYYADGSCGLVDDYNGSKTPVGVVYYVTDGGYHGKVVALSDLYSDKNGNFDPQKPFNGSIQYFVYGLRNLDIKLNIPDNITDETLKDVHSAAFSGKELTQQIASLENTDETNCVNKIYQPQTKEYNQYCQASAAKAALEFYPLNVDSDDPLVGQGKWYLPSVGELLLMIGVDLNKVKIETNNGFNWETLSILEKSLDTLKTKGVTTKSFANYERFYHWSVNPNLENAGSAFYVTEKANNTSHSLSSGGTRSENAQVRPVLEF